PCPVKPSPGGPVPLCREAAWHLPQNLLWAWPAGAAGFRPRQESARGLAMKFNNLQDVFLEQLRDMYDAEQRLVKALPKMAKAAASPDLRSGFEQHLEQTKNHVTRLEQ